MAVKFPPSSTISSEPEPHTTKRIKLSQTADPTAFGSSDLLTSATPRLKQEYEESVPYHHAVLQDIFNDQILRNARKEIKENLCFTPKETDIYKIFQTGDLANLDGLSGEETNQLQHVKLIRDSLYSEQFRNFLQSVTSCGPLSGKQTDMSINDYRQGCHLLNHDDVIGTRRVSFILYLTDPDNPWEMNDGGSLELYPVDPKTSQPLHTPSKKILPRWNQFVFFVVQPGHSFHSVEEVYTPKKNRLSISGWFHFPNEGEKGYEESLETKKEEDKKSESLGASLQQLTGNQDQDFTFLDEPIVATDSEFLTDDESSFLSKYIDPSYLNSSELGKIRNKFVTESTINLIEFLDYKFSCDLKRAILLNEARDLVSVSNSKDSDLHPPEFSGPHFDMGTQEKGWIVTGPPHKHRYLKPDPNTLALNPSTRKLNELKELLESPSFIKWLSIISASEILAHNVAPRRFRPGLDYTLATANNSPILELHLSLTPSHGWEDEELGGWECYMASTEEDESDPAIYNAPKTEGSDDGDTNLLTIYPTWNSFHLVLRDSDILTFTKYVSYKSPQSKWDIKATYQVQDDAEEEDED
ncbi:Oxoglutarate and iron-dependent oxygenase degradation C-term-domain-containing protein [Melampsora americana]|nr:Oxoglutarate and iron-dependent oxygenase degradation C-term-domain-containing protein [Melampsora americana]